MPYNYTVPRGPVMAMYSGPGPCYALPGMCGHLQQPHDPRSVHEKRPAYSFGLRPPLLGPSISPGPKYFPHSKIQRDGMEGTPHYSIAMRIPALPPFNTPGPGSYRPEKGFPSSEHPTAPSYSLRDRTNLSSKHKTPGPNKYTLPPMIGNTVQSTKTAAPNFSMRLKPTIGSFAEDLARAPGPGTYDETLPSIYKQKQPLYSIGARVYPPGDNTTKPGPGAHRIEDINIHTEPPAFSFGIHHTQYKTIPMMEPQD